MKKIEAKSVKDFKLRFFTNEYAPAFFQKEINAAKNYYLADKGVVITNSFFSKSAKNLSTSADIILIDRLAFDELLSADKTNKKLLLSSYFE